MQSYVKEGDLLRELRTISERHSNKLHPKLSVSNNTQESQNYMNANDGGKQFLERKEENADLNQYWYSQRTIDSLCEGILEALGEKSWKRIAFLSTPSLYYSMPLDIRKSCFLLDYDREWKDDRGYVFYDFNHPLEFDPSLLGTFDMVVIDPPFITESVWRKYAVSAISLLKFDPKEQSQNAKVLATSVGENLSLMKELFGPDMRAAAYLPSIPKLVYQYNIFMNFDSKTLSMKNPEVHFE